MAPSNQRKQLTKAALLCFMALIWVLVVPPFVRDDAGGSLALFGPPVLFAIAASLFFGRSFL
jgi:hypothetical protein